ncbi:MAG: hypothetical protein ABL900_00225 [Burkholderiaceae bacterium]
MNVNLEFSRRIASALLVSLVLAGWASSPNAASPELLQRIEAARTRGDHEALAAHYEKEVVKARAMAAEHRQMGKSYQGLVAAKRGEASMAAHCDAIVRNQEGIAMSFEGMAAAHRQMAKQAQP